MLLLLHFVTISVARASAEKFPEGSGRTKEKTRPKNSAIKPPTTLSVLCMKIQGGAMPPPADDQVGPKPGGHTTCCWCWLISVAAMILCSLRSLYQYLLRGLFETFKTF